MRTGGNGCERTTGKWLLPVFLASCEFIAARAVLHDWSLSGMSRDDRWSCSQGLPVLCQS